MKRHQKYFLKRAAANPDQLMYMANMIGTIRLMSKSNWDLWANADTDTPVLSMPIQTATLSKQQIKDVKSWYDIHRHWLAINNAMYIAIPDEVFELFHAMSNNTRH